MAAFGIIETMGFFHAKFGPAKNEKKFFATFWLLRQNDLLNRFPHPQEWNLQDNNFYFRGQFYEIF